MYAEVTLEKTLARRNETVCTGHRDQIASDLLAARISFCEQAKLSEELVPLDSIAFFFRCHEAHARIPSRYPGVQILKNAVPKFAVEAYEKTFRREPLPSTAWACLGTHWRNWEVSDTKADMVASSDKLVVFPKASADACLVSAYALLKGEEVFMRQSWAGSVLAPLQAVYQKKYGISDFQFWVTYGSWTSCIACGTWTFNDRYFRERVYSDQSTSERPDLLSAYRRSVPDDPIVHNGNVGVSSRWWYLPGMYTPEDDSCPCCSGMETPGQKLIESMAASAEHGVKKTKELYRIPVQQKTGHEAKECISFPLYLHGDSKAASAKTASRLQVYALFRP